MKKKKIYLSTLLALCFCMIFGATALAGSKPTAIQKSGKTTRTVYIGDEVKLSVKADGDDNYLSWTKSGSSLAFEDNDRNDDDIELHAVKTGTTKVTCKIKGTTKKVTYTVNVKTRKYNSADQKISRKGAATVTIRVGQDRDLEVKKAKGVKDNYLKWSIADKTIVRFDDDDIFDDEVEIQGRKKGTTTVTCKHLLTKATVKFKVRVV